MNEVALQIKTENANNYTSDISLIKKPQLWVDSYKIINEAS